MALLTLFALAILLLGTSLYKVPALQKRIDELIEKWEEKREDEEELAPLLREAARECERTQLMNRKSLWKAIRIVSAISVPIIVLLSFIVLR